MVPQRESTGHPRVAEFGSKLAVAVGPCVRDIAFC